LFNVPNPFPNVKNLYQKSQLINYHYFLRAWQNSLSQCCCERNFNTRK
jgi:hypothetical protein